jgi:type I restriction enzyme S subunit
MSEWKEVKLGDVLLKITKGTTPPRGKGFVDEGINYIKSDAIGYDGRIDDSLFVSIDEETHEKFKRSQLEKDDILFSMAGVFLGKNAIVKEEHLPANTNQALAIIRLNQDLAKPKFVSYYLRQPAVIEYVNNMSGQSAQPNINFQEISSIEIPLPKIEEQENIIDVLASLDDKIDLLHRQNQTLEQMAETLFRQWFVEEESELIPLGDCIKTTSGGTPSRKRMDFYEGGIYQWVKSKELKGGYILDTEERITVEALKKSSAKLLPENSVLIAMYGATVGQFAIIGQEATCNQAICACIPNDEFPYTFIYHTIKVNVDELKSRAVGSAQQNISQVLIKSMEISVNENIDKFHAEVDPMMKKIKANYTQIRTLTALRDTLLPKLMSGEVSLSNFGEVRVEVETKE